MTTREALRILMLSPFYYKLKPVHRKKLIEEYCELFIQVSTVKKK